MKIEDHVLQNALTLPFKEIFVKSTMKNRVFFKTVFHWLLTHNVESSRNYLLSYGFTVWKSTMEMYKKINIFSVKSTFLLEKLLNNWFHGKILSVNTFSITFPHCGFGSKNFVKSTYYAMISRHFSCAVKWRIYSHRWNTSLAHFLLSNFFSRNVAFTKFLP